MCNRISRVGVIGVVAVFSCATHADQVWINPAGLVVSEQRTVATFDYQLGPTMASVSTQYRWSEQRAMSQYRELGGRESISGRAYEFTLSHYASQGMIFTLRDLGTNEMHAMMWGALSPQSSPKGQHENVDSPFNALVLTANATTEGSSMEFSDLVFSSALLSSRGAFEDGLVSTPGVATRVQRLIASINLAEVDWTMSGTIRGVRDAFNGGTGPTDFSIAQTMMTVTVIPLPTPLWLAAAGLGFIMGRRRR